jgi:ubiquitin-protein ligase
LDSDSHLLGFYRGRVTIKSTNQEWLITMSGPHKSETSRKHLTRLETCKQLFHAFINRSLAYDYPIEIGLLEFGTKVSVTCPFTPMYETFRDKIDSVEADGDTALYDALDTACTELLNWKQAKPKERDNAKLRIVCLSDGANTTGCTRPEMIAAQLQKHGIVVDAIQIGSAVADQYLQGIVCSTNGYWFTPTKLTGALQICELETFASQDERKVVSKGAPVRSSYDLKRLAYSNTNEWSVENGIVPPRRETYNTKGHVITLKDALELKHDPVTSDNDSISTDGKVITSGTPVINRTKRLMQELKHLSEHGHPAFDIYVQQDDFNSWSAIVEGPDSTPYVGGVWKIHLTFPNQYPMLPPEIRFSGETPILHCNVNSYGKICHSVFDRNYSPDMTVLVLLEAIYSLLLSPESSDPLDV